MMTFTVIRKSVSYKDLFPCLFFKVPGKVLSWFKLLTETLKWLLLFICMVYSCFGIVFYHILLLQTTFVKGRKKSLKQTNKMKLHHSFGLQYIPRQSLLALDLVFGHFSKCICVLPRVMDWSLTCVLSLYSLLLSRDHGKDTSPNCYF